MIRRQGVTQPDDVRPRRGTTEAAGTCLDMALGVQVGADQPPSTMERPPPARRASTLLRQPLDPAPS